MNAPARSTQWAREVLAGRVVWQPLGVMVSLWAWFGWLTPWFAALLPHRSGAQAPNAAVFIMGAALLGHASAALVNRMNLPGVTAAAGRLLVLLVVLGGAWWAYIGMPAGGPMADGRSQWQATWVVILGLGYAWWRAGRLSAGEALEADTTLRRLFTGVLLAASAMVLFPQASRGAGATFLPLYVGGGLAGVALGQVNDASRRRGGRPLPFSLSWHAGLLLGVAVVIVLGVGVGWVLSSSAAWSVVEAGARLLAGGARVLASILAPVVEAFFRLVGPVFDALIRMLQSWLEGAEEVKITVPQPIAPPGGEGAEAEEANQVLAQLGVALRLIATVLGAAVLLWMAIRTTRRVRRPFEDGEAETIEPATNLAPGGRARGLRAFLRSAIRLPGRARGLYHALLVRRVYAQLLEWAADRGRPRKPAETPLEFGIALAGLRPQLQEELDAITQAYLHVRYGEAPEDTEMVNRVLASWDRVRRSVAPIRPMDEGNSR